MAPTKSSPMVVFLLFLATYAVINYVADAGQSQWTLGRPLTCTGTIAECSGAADELQMDSEINRRMLDTEDYISYDALTANSVPCSQDGASYYNCRAGAEANPYSRGCSAITQCRS